MALGMTSGRMDRQIVLQTATATQSDSGEPTFDWNSAVSQYLWAEWLPAGTTEAYRASQRLGSEVSGVFRIYDMDPRPSPEGTRILFDGLIFDVKPYVEVGRGRGLELAVVAHGEGGS